MSIKIIVDSTSDFTNEDIKKYNLGCARLTINWNGKEYIDGLDMSKKEFYEKLVIEKTTPTTSQVTAPIFEEMFYQAIEQGDEVVVILLSKKFSGTYQSANIARDSLETGSEKIYLVDSQSTTLGTGILIHEAIKLRDAGKTAVEIVKVLEDLAPRIKILAAVETLKFLHRGGRLSGAATVVRTLLSVKPILELSKGEIQVVHKTRGNNAAYQWLAQRVKEIGVEKGTTVMVGSTQCQDLMEQFIGNLNGFIDREHLAIGEIGIVVGTHAGPGCVGCAFIAPKKNQSK